MIDPRTATASPHPALASGLLCAILVVAALLRVVDLDRVSFWGDEAHTVRRGSNLPAVVRTWRCAPLYLTTYIALLFGKGETAVRLPHALAGIASVYLLYRIGLRHVGARAALLSAFLLAVSVFHVHKSRDARYYSLMVFFTLVSFQVLERALRERRASWLVAFAAVSAVNIQNHPFAVIPAGAFCLYGLGVWWTASRASGTSGDEVTATASGAPPALRPAMSVRRAMVIGGALVLAFPPIVYFFRPDVWQSLLERIAGTGTSRFDLRLDLAFLERALIWFGAGPGLPVVVHASCFVLGAAVLALGRPRTFFLVGTLLAATVAALAIAIWIGPAHPFHLRYIVFLLPFFLLVVAAGADGAAAWLVAGMRRAMGRPATAGSAWAWAAPLFLSVAAFTALSAPVLGRYSRYQLADYRGAVALCLERARPGDAIAMPAYRVAGHAEAIRQYLKRARPRDGGPLIVRKPEDLSALQARHGRVWLIEVVPVALAEGSVPLDPWVSEHLVRIARIPSGLWSERLEDPVLLTELIIHGPGG
jgi:hypothetical protein